MAIEKILHKIQSQINALAPTLELFVEDTIQPSVSDCDKLLTQLQQIQEQLAVYKWHKQNKELSPSFNIHAKVSDAEIKISTPPAAETREPEKSKAEPKEVKAPDPVHVTSTPTKMKPPLMVGINDKFRFINELFSQNSSEYSVALEQINNLANWSEAELYLNSLKNIYGWKENNEVVKYFYSLVKKRFE